MPSCDSFGNVDGDAERQVGFLLTPTFSILPFISAAEPLRAANRFGGEALYSWHVFTADGEAVCAANGISQAADAAIDDIAAFPTVDVCGPHDPNRFQCKKISTAGEVPRFTPRVKIWSLSWDSVSQTHATFHTTLIALNIGCCQS